MGGLNEAFRDALINPETDGTGEALSLAEHMSVRDVCATLVSDIAEDSPERTYQFVEAWLPRLLPGERLDAAAATSELYVLDLVHLPGATDRGFQHELAAAAGVLATVCERISDYGEVAESPDASFDRDFAQRYRTIASDVLKPVIAQLATGAAELASYRDGQLHI